MRDLDLEAIIIDILKNAPELEGIPIYAGWPGWEVPPELAITVNLVDMPLDKSQDVNMRSIRVPAQVWVNVWDTKEESARSTAVKVHNILQGKRYYPPEGAEIVIMADDLKPQHEPDPAGTIYHFILDLKMLTTEKIEGG